MNIPLMTYAGTHLESLNPSQQVQAVSAVVSYNNDKRLRNLGNAKETLFKNFVLSLIKVK